MHELTSAELARLADYFAQELNPAERVAAERWIDDSPARRRWVEELRQSRLDLGENEAEDALLNLSARGEVVVQTLAAMRAEGRPVTAVKRGDSRSTDHVPVLYGSVKGTSATTAVVRRWCTNSVWRMAGAIAAVLTLVIVGWSIERSRWLSTSPDIVTTYTTANGERATITLPDGNVIKLNVASRVQIPADYENGNRTVHLTGEALFAVEHQSNAPFTVVAGPSTTRVLGTKFLVRYYQTDTAATVAVQQGKVMVQSTVLTAAQQVSVSRLGSSEVRPVAATRFDFVSDFLLVDDLPLPDAIVELNRWYNVDIRLGDAALAQRKVFGRFNTGSPTDVIDYLERMLDVRIERDGRILTLYSRK